MNKILAFIASVIINCSMIPAVASECSSSKDIDVARARWALLRHQTVSAADKENVCRAYASSFYKSVTLRQITVKCADRVQVLGTLDSEIDAFNACWRRDVAADAHYSMATLTCEDGI